MDATEYDEHRTSVLEARGYQVLRVWNNDVFQNTPGVMEQILALLETEPHRNTLIPSPSPKTGEGSSSVQDFNICA